MRRGVDGFRLDAVNYLFEDELLRDNPVLPELRPGSKTEHQQELKYTRDPPEIHPTLKRLRRFTDAYDKNRLLIGEAYVPKWEELMKYYGDRDDELQLPFNFFLVMDKARTALDANVFRQVINDSERALAGRWTTYVLSNHDIPRAFDRYGDGQHNDEIAKLMATMLLTLRGSPFIYYGEEIGMKTTEPQTIDEVRDPVGKRYFPANKGRDGERTPMQWTRGRNAGFSTAEKTWLPVPSTAQTRNVETEANDPNSILNFYKRLIRLRRQSPALTDGDYQAVGDDPKVFAYRRQTTKQSVIALLNMSGESRAFDLSGANGERKSSVYQLLLSSARGAEDRTFNEKLTLAPFEAVVLEMRNK